MSIHTVRFKLDSADQALAEILAFRYGSNHLFNPTSTWWAHQMAPTLAPSGYCTFETMALEGIMAVWHPQPVCYADVNQQIFVEVHCRMRRGMVPVGLLSL